MISKFSFTLLAAAMIFSSCKKKSDDTAPAAPVANFSYAFTASHFAPAQVSFTNNSTDATSYVWDYGDGNTSTVFSGTHTYNDGGNFLAKLTATGNGETNTTSTLIQVLDSPTVAKITYIQLTAFPAHDGAGNNWDSTTGPDIYFRIYQGAGIVANYDTTVYADTNVPPVLLNLSTHPFVINDTSFSTIYSVAIFDKESSPPDSVMGVNVGFYINEFMTTHPSTINITYDNSIKYTLGITWQ